MSKVFDKTKRVNQVAYCKTAMCLEQ